MFLQRLTDYALSYLLNSDYGVAVCQLDPEPLKATICELWNRGHRHLVLEATDGSLWLLVAASRTNDGNLVGDARRWTREFGRQFHIKRSGEAFETPTPNSVRAAGWPDYRNPLHSCEATNFYVLRPVHAEDAPAELRSDLTV